MDAQVRLWLALENVQPEGCRLADGAADLASIARPAVAEQVAMARIRLAQGDPGRALAILTDLVTTVQEANLGERLIEALALQAISFRADRTAGETGAQPCARTIRIRARK